MKTPDGYRFSLQFAAYSPEYIQAGETLEELDAAGYGKLSEMPEPEKIAAYYRSLLEKMKEEESGLDIPEEEELLEKVFST